MDKNPDKPEWPVHGMDKNQKRHFRHKVGDYKVQNDVLYHLHTNAETVNGETIKRCKFNVLNRKHLVRGKGKNNFTICGFFTLAIKYGNAF